MIIFLGIARSAINIGGDIPFIGNILEHIGKTVAGLPEGLGELTQIYADDPTRLINILTTYLHKQGPITVCPFPIHFQIKKKCRMLSIQTVFIYSDNDR